MHALGEAVSRFNTLGKDVSRFNALSKDVSRFNDLVDEGRGGSEHDYDYCEQER